MSAVIQKIDQAMALLAEARALAGATPQPAGENCEQFILRMYRDILGQAADPGGFAHWVGMCTSGAMTREQIEAAFRGVAPPPPVQPTTPTQPAGGNPSAIVPAWGQWDQVYPGRGFTFTPGLAVAFPVPVNPEGGDGVTFTIGQSPSQAPGQVDLELCLSLAPGVIDTSPAHYLTTAPFGFRNAFGARVYQRESGFNREGTFKGFPEHGQWFMNVRLVSGAPSVHSIQWAR